MSLNENQSWIIRFLASRPRGHLEGMPHRTNIDANVMEADIADLHKRRLVRVHGPPNQNAEL
jgi:hypothetical protein